MNMVLLAEKMSESKLIDKIKESFTNN